MQAFRFLRQAHSVELLLKLCVEALPSLPSDLAGRMTSALADFESSTAVTMWGIGDINDDPEQSDHLVLSQSERRDVINRLCTGYECKDADWTELDRLCREVRSERPTAQEPETDLFNAEAQTGFIISLEESGTFFAEQWQAGVILRSHEGNYAAVRDWVDEHLPAHRDWVRANASSATQHSVT